MNTSTPLTTETTEEDLVIGDPEAAAEEEEIEDFDLHAEIQSACNALSAVAEIDEKLFSKEKARMIRTIRRKALEILYQNVNDIHADIFGRKDEKEGEEED